jgi:hypothetical protein
MTGRLSGQALWRRSRLVEVGAEPAAGADWAVTVPAGELWELVTVQAELVTDATVADRRPILSIGDGVATFASIPSVAVQAASLTVAHLWGQNLAATDGGSAQAMPLPKLLLQPGWTVAVDSTNLQAADAWSAPRLYVVQTTVRGGAVDLSRLPDLLVAMAAGDGGAG